MLVSHVRVPPAMEAILSSKRNRVQAFLAAGHVCVVMGFHEYPPIAEKYRVVIVSGTIGDHGIAVLSAREDLGFEMALESDVARSIIW